MIPATWVFWVSKFGTLRLIAGRQPLSSDGTSLSIGNLLVYHQVFDMPPKSAVNHPSFPGTDEAAACTILHDQIDVASMVIALVDGTDVGMIQLFHDANLLLEVLSHVTCPVTPSCGAMKPQALKGCPMKDSDWTPQRAYDHWDTASFWSPPPTTS